MTRPLFDPERLRILAETGLMDSDHEEAFDRLARLAAQLLGVSVALVSFLDDTRQYIKSATGLEVREVPISHSTCVNVIDGGVPFIVDDTATDDRLAGHPGIAAFGVGAYCGVPLKDADGFTLGSLCVVEMERRSWTPAEVAVLEELAAIVMSEVTLRRLNRGLRERDRALAVSEERFRRTFEDAAIGIALLSPEGRWLEVNPTFAAMLGYPAEDLVGAMCHEHTHPEDLAHEATLRAQLLTGELSTVTQEKRYLHRDGTPVFCRVSMAATRDSDGNPISFITQIEDITERRRVEAERDAAQERQAELLNLMPGTWLGLYDRDLVCVSMQGSIFAETGIDSDSYVGKPAEATMPAAQFAQLAPLLRAGLEGGTDHARYFSEVTGRTFNIDVVPYRSDGEILGTVAVARDISALLAHEERTRMLATIVRQSDEAIIAKDPNAIITAWNGAAERLYGYSAAEAIGQPVSMLVPSARQAEVQELLAHAMAGDAISSFATQRVRRDGSLIDVSLSVSPLLDETGEPAGASIIARDITSQMRSEEARREAEERLRVTIEHAPIGVGLIQLGGSLAGRLLSSNEHLKRLLGHVSAMSPALTLGQVVHPDDLPGVTADLALLGADPAARTERELRLVRSDGTADWVLLAGASVPSRSGLPQQAVIHALAIGERKRAEQELQFLAEHDSLTGLNNRRSFGIELARSLSRARENESPLSVLMIDLDGFKAINDTFGHSAGDAIIAEFGALLQTTLRTSDVLARLGGDEFAALLTQTDAGQAQIVAEKILTLAREELGCGEGDARLGVTASIGIATDIGIGAPDEIALLANADAAMYQAKQAGRDRVVSYSFGGPAPSVRSAARQPAPAR